MSTMTAALLRTITASLSPPPTVRSCGGHVLRLLALTIHDGSEQYLVSSRCPGSDGASWRAGTLIHEAGSNWMLAHDEGADTQPVDVGSPDELFATAVGEGARPSLRAAAPHWPDRLLRRMEHRRIVGDGTIAFDARTFLSLLASSPIDRPLLLPGAAEKLGLTGLHRATELVSSVATTLRCGRVDVSPQAFAEMIVRVERAERAVRALESVGGKASKAAPKASKANRRGKRRGKGRDRGGESVSTVSAAIASSSDWWSGRGRLICRFPDGELAQLGADVSDGVRLAIGKGVRRVTFPPDEPMGVGLGPLAVDAQRGAEVGEVDAGSAAERLGVKESMVLLAIEEDGAEAEDTSRLTEMPFESVLSHIDSVRDAGSPLTLLLDTAAPATNLYAVEMPAPPLFAALAASEAQLKTWQRADVDAGAAMSELLASAGGPAPLWTEKATKAFIGDAGSVTSAHVDIAPDLEVLHGLHGIKFVGVATHEATARLAAEHIPREEEEAEADEAVATSVPTERALDEREAELLSDDEVSVACVLPGDACVFHSACFHFASNGADDLNAALFHGMVTEAALPRLKEAAQRGSSGDEKQMSAQDVLREIVGE